MKKYLTVKEFSSYAKVSDKAIYQRLDTSLKPYVKKVNGKKLINNSALKDIYNIEVIENEDVEILDKDLKSSIKSKAEVKENQGKREQNQDELKERSIETDFKKTENSQEKSNDNQALLLKVEYLEELLKNKQEQLDREIENGKNLRKDIEFMKEKYSSLEQNYNRNLEFLQTTQVKMIVDQEEKEPGEPQQTPGIKKNIFQRIFS